MRAALPILLAGIAAAALAGGCRASLAFDEPLRLQEGDWSQEGGSPYRSNNAAGEAPRPARERWRAGLAGSFTGGALLAGGGVVFAPTKTGGVEAFDIATGERRAAMPFRAPLHGAPAAEGDRIVVSFATRDPSLACIDMAGGRLLWQRAFGVVEAGLLAAGGRVVAAASHGRVACFGIGDSVLAWERRVPGALLAAPAATDSALYLPCANGDLLALSLRDGRELWRVPTLAPLLAAPAVAGTRLYAVNAAGDALAVDLRSGAVAWRRNLGAPFYAAPAVDDERVYLAGSDGTLRALRRGDGGEEWSATLPVLLATAPLVTDASVLLAVPDGRICAFNRSSGALRWTYALDSQPRSSPLLYRDVIVVATADDELIAIAGEDRP